MALDVDFNTGRVSPSIDTRPTTPTRFGQVFFSAPASPARHSDYNHGFYDDLPFSSSEKRIWWFPSPSRVNDNAFASSSEALNGSKINKIKAPLYDGRVSELEASNSPLLSPRTPNSKISQRKKSFWSNFSLFRSASEGRASENDPFRKYAEMYRKHQVAI